jgi:hypothetical protein
MSRETTAVLCPVCDLLYCRGLPEDDREHRRRHRANMAVIRPKPHQGLAQLHEQHGPFVPVDGLGRPKWPSNLLYRIAKAFRREMTPQRPRATR